MSGFFARIVGIVMMVSSLYFIGDEIKFQGFWWGIPTVGVVVCFGLGIWGLFNGWQNWLSFGLILVGIGLVLVSGRVFMNVISLRDLLLTLALLLGGFKLMTFSD